eukprot:CAMPEP_0179201394 /NCGR_PEP_ID=MMETSP0796-20121207/100231_1 /TAXON_ID=73915 /ORGANISM="Pyrodinium bahamense, Strain pbaha01" /LENGTH=93 /DNA_ID=CAMNT_0020905951 /DNA_START=259 /DNA_END=538 /DNA_ORIENTATION=+
MPSVHVTAAAAWAEGHHLIGPTKALGSWLKGLVVVANGHILCLLQLPLVLRDESSVNLDLRRLGVLANELQVALVRQTPCKPEERLLEVVIAP